MGFDIPRGGRVWDCATLGPEVWEVDNVCLSFYISW